MDPLLKLRTGSVLHVAPTRAEVIIDDDEGLSALTVFWAPMGGYLCVSRLDGSSRTSCEYCNQINSFQSNALNYQLENGKLFFSLSNKETFDRHSCLQNIVVHMENIVHQKSQIAECLEVIFTRPDGS